MSAAHRIPIEILEIIIRDANRLRAQDKSKLFVSVHEDIKKLACFNFHGASLILLDQFPKLKRLKDYPIWTRRLYKANKHKRLKQLASKAGIDYHEVKLNSLLIPR